jgi:transporter family protein
MAFCKEKLKIMWWIYALLSALFASLTAIFSKLGVANVSSNVATAIRTIVIVIIAWGIVFAKGEVKSISTISKSSFIFLVISGITTGLSWLFYFKALQMGKVSQVAPVDKLSIALTIILSAIFLKDVLTVKTAIGSLLIIAGTLVLVFK